jgi:hypothetical protein
VIRRGEDWGGPGNLPAGRPAFGSDRELALAVAAEAPWLAESNPGETPPGVGPPELRAPTFGLLAGDLHRTLGSPKHGEADLRTGDAMAFPIDVGVAALRGRDGSERKELFVAHLEAFAGRARFAGPTVIAMNAAFIDGDNLGPRAHPGDGLLDLTVGRLGMWDRVRSARRQRTGSHLPHPDLQTVRRRDHRLGERGSGMRHISLDGHPVDGGDVVGVWLVPNSLTVVV